MKREFSRWLIQQAARGAPPDLAERLEEEWLADLEARTGQLARLRFGVGCCWATKVIAHEYNAAKVLAAASAVGSKTMAAYAHYDDPFFSRRTITFLAIVGLHVVLIYGFATGLARNVIAALPPIIVGVVLPATPKHIDPPPAIGEPPIKAQHLVIPPTDGGVEIPVDADPIQGVSSEVVPPPQPAQPPPVPMVKRVSGGPGKGFPNTEDYYPADKIRVHQEGAVTVRTCVDEKGRLTAVPTVAETSGSTGFDEAALRLARAGSGHYRASTENGQPVSSCYSFRVRFQMKD